MRLGKQVLGWWRGAIAGALLLVQAPAHADAPATSRAAAAAPRPAIWLLEDEDTRIYLFGTTHMFERGFRWRSPRLDAVIREADELVMETADGEEMTDERLAASMFMAKSVPILSRVSEDRRARLAELVEQSGIPRETWDRMHSWAAGFLLMGMQMEQAGAGEEQRALSGAEEELTALFRGAGKPISAVESSDLQIAMFRTLSPRAQRAFLESIVDGWDMPEGAEGEPQGEVSWARGDVEAIAREMDALPPDIYEALLTRRNRAWTEWLAYRLERPGTVLFAVGAGHLAGRDSVQTMLAARGLRTQRID